MFKYNYLVMAQNLKMPINATHTIEILMALPYQDTLMLLQTIPDYEQEDSFPFIMAGLLAGSAIIALLSLVAWRKGWRPSIIYRRSK